MTDCCWPSVVQGRARVWGRWSGLRFLLLVTPSPSSSFLVVFSLGSRIILYKYVFFASWGLSRSLFQTGQENGTNLSSEEGLGFGGRRGRGYSAR